MSRKSCKWEPRWYIRTDGLTYLTDLSQLDAFCNYANAPQMMMMMMIKRIAVAGAVAFFLAFLLKHFLFLSFISIFRLLTCFYIF